MLYEIVEYRPELKAQVLELQKHLWGPDLAINEAYLSWKYEHNPYVDATHIYLALCGSQVVGMRGFFGARWQMGGKEKALSCLCAGDLVIAPEHRNRGLLTQIMTFAQDHLASSEFEYVLNLSGSPATQLSSLTTGWCMIGVLQDMDWHNKRTDKSYLPFVDFLSTKLRRMSPRIVFRSFDKQIGDGSLAGKAGFLFASVPQAEAMAALVQNIGYDGRLRHDRSPAFFVWRFHNPFSSYRFVSCGGSAFEGYLVLQASNRGKEGGVSIVDWEAASSHVLADLLEATMRYGRFAHLKIRTTIFSPEMRSVLGKLGFREFERRGGVKEWRPTVLLRPLRPEKRRDVWTFDGCRLLEITSWDVRMIDSDGF